MVSNSAYNQFFKGLNYGGLQNKLVECATKIYIAQMQLEKEKLQEEYDDLYEGHDKLSYEWAKLKKENRELNKKYSELLEDYNRKSNESNDCEVYKRLYQNMSKVNDQLREIYYEQVDKNEKQRLEHARNYNRLLKDYKTLKAHYEELSKECKESQTENLSLLISQKSSERTNKKILDEVQQLHDRVMELIAEEMNEDE